MLQRIKDWLHEQRINRMHRRIKRLERTAARSTYEAGQELAKLLQACRDRSPSQVARMRDLDDARLAAIQAGTSPGVLVLAGVLVGKAIAERTTPHEKLH